MPSPLPLDVDLGAERLTIERGGIGEDDVTIRVVGFEDVAGSRGDDTIVGSEVDNFFGGTRGDDTSVGRDGRDVLGYCPDLNDNSVTAILELGVVTLLDGGEVVGRDSFAASDVEAGTVDVIELVSADAERLAENTIDASAGAPGPVGVRIDLGAGEVFSGMLGRVEATFVEDVGGFSAGDGFGFDVENFANVVGTDQDDALFGDDGSNTLDGARGDDTLRGRGGDDRLDGGRGDDDLRGGDGADRLDGRRGDDNLLGGDGDDRLFGQQGYDVIRGGQGADELGGGSGADTFRWTQGDIAADAGQAVDIVQDFGTDDFLLLAGQAISAREAFGLADAEGLVGGVGFDLNFAGNQIVLRADGEDSGSEIDASEVFALLPIEADDFSIA